MILDTGIVRFYAEPDSGGVGRPDHEELELLYESWYGDLTIGVTRHWMARQAGSEVSREIRIIDPGDRELLRMGDIAMTDGHRYRVEQIQYRRDDDGGFDAADVSLSRIGDKYDRYRH